MADRNPVAEALDLLKLRRAAINEELAQVEEAIAALSRVGRSAQVVEPARRSGQSVRTKVIALLEEDNRDWSTSEIIDEYERRGDPIKALDPTNSVRSAMAKARVKGTLLQMATGRYKHAMWEDPPLARSDTEEPPMAP